MRAYSQDSSSKDRRRRRRSRATRTTSSTSYVDETTLSLPSSRQHDYFDSSLSGLYPFPRLRPSHSPQPFPFAPLSLLTPYCLSLDSIPALEYSFLPHLCLLSLAIATSLLPCTGVMIYLHSRFICVMSNESVKVGPIRGLRRIFLLFSLSLSLL